MKKHEYPFFLIWLADPFSIPWNNIEDEGRGKKEKKKKRETWPFKLTTKDESDYSWQLNTHWYNTFITKVANHWSENTIFAQTHSHSSKKKKLYQFPQAKYKMRANKRENKNDYAKNGTISFHSQFKIRREKTHTNKNGIVSFIWIL